jgi:hypothetical protein
MPIWYLFLRFSWSSLSYEYTYQIIWSWTYPRKHIAHFHWAFLFLFLEKNKNIDVHLSSIGYMNPSGQWEEYPHYVNMEGLHSVSPVSSWITELVWFFYLEFSKYTFAEGTLRQPVTHAICWICKQSPNDVWSLFSCVYCWRWPAILPRALSFLKSLLPATCFT